MTIRSALFAYLDAMPSTDLTGWQLQQAMERATKRRPYPSTILGYARDYADRAGASFTCVDPIQSRYHFEPGARISGAIE
jgi:hypothetical protein